MEDDMQRKLLQDIEETIEEGHRSDRYLYNKVYNLEREVEYLKGKLIEYERAFLNAHAMTITECTIGLQDGKVVHICSQCGAVIPIDKVQRPDNHNQKKHGI